eukprot:2635085-Prymnesium_polylepis.1
MRPTQIDAATTSHAAMRPVSSIVTRASGIGTSPMRLGAAATSPSQIGAPTRGTSAAVGPPIAARHTTGRPCRASPRAA